MNTERKISIIDKNNFKVRGLKLYNTNNTMKDLANFMEYPPNKEFFDKYFSSKEDIVCMNTFIKMYRHIENNDPYEKLTIIHDCINDPKIRRRLFSSKKNLLELDNKPLDKTLIKPLDKTLDKTLIKPLDTIEYKKNV